MGDPSLPQQLVDAVIAGTPDYEPGTRPIHTVGIGVVGYFQASDVAPKWCTAEHFRGQKVPVTVRFSNGSGSPRQHDYWSDVRGMATRFHLADDTATDLIAMTLREFFSPTVADFLAFAAASKMQPVSREPWWRKILDLLQLRQPLPDPMPGQTMSPAAGSLDYANRHRSAQLAVFDAASIGAPSSYARATYNAVHTFVASAPDGTRRYVRFLWQPIAGIQMYEPDKVADPDDYLQGELRARLAHWPAEFHLLMTIGESGDAFDDPTIPWNLKRTRIVMGTLTLTGVPEDQDAHNEKLSFNPCLLTDGIALSNDPVLAARRDAYILSAKLRGAAECPFR